MKKKYEKPNMEIYPIETSKILVASGQIDSGAPTGPARAPYYDEF